MTQKFSKFASKIKYTPSGSFEQADIYFAKLEAKDVFYIGFELPVIPEVEEIKEFLECLDENFGFTTKIQFRYLDKTIGAKKAFEFTKYLIDYFLQNVYISSQLYQEQFTIEDNNIIISFVTTKGATRFKENAIKLKKLFNIFGIDNKVVLKKSENQTLSLLEAKKQKEAEITSKKEFFSKHKTPEVKEEVKIKKRSYSKTVVSLQEAKEEFQNQPVTVEGMIFEREEKQTKTGWNIIELSITDFEDAIYVSIFAGKTDEEKDKYKNYVVGQWVNVQGKLELNTYRQNQPEIKSSKLSLIEPKISKKQDNAEVKRVELNVKTRMSTMDGLVSPKELISFTKQLGHTAVAVTDSNSVQSFPNLFNESKGIKAIYGVSINTIERGNGAVFNLSEDSKLKDKTYVVFDLETTGLSPIHHEIIEFGAIKLKAGKIINKKQFFMKPKGDISEFTTELTGITNDMVKNSFNEKEGLKQMIEYFDDSVLVAHNAPFDLGFVNEKMEQYGFEKINYTYIDTVSVAKIIEPKAKRFNLEKVATRFGHKYDPTIAHRADYDAEVLANVWMTMVSNLRRTGIKTLKELSEQLNDKIYESRFDKEITLLAKNNKGLKEIFKIISLTSTKQYYRSPKLFWDQLPKSKDVLIGSGGIKSKLVDLMLTGTKKQIIENISKYDYIEVQPLRNYSHLIARGNIKRYELVEAIKFIITEAKRQNKIVVATGDVRYIKDTDKLFHSVYINAKGLGGVRHYLFKYNEAKPDFPTQSFLTTEEMIEAFHFLGDEELTKEIVVTNTNKISDMIEECVVIKDKLYTPKIDDSDENLSCLVWKTAKEKYGDPLPNLVQERVEKELGNIIKYGFGVIYYIAHKLVKKSNEDGYLVGSRGSVGSSIVATLSGITEVNPLPAHYICTECKTSEFFTDGKYSCGYDLPDKQCDKCNTLLEKEGHDIPFETFLGFEANKVPDIDLNFSGEYQPIIHKEVEKEFGKTHAFRAGTISTVAEKTAFGYVLAWAEETGKTMSRAFIEFMAKKVAGTKRTTGQHPGGIIVIPKEFSAEDFSPINYPANDKNSDWLTTHFDFHAIHDNVLKLDLLGHDDPTAIRVLQKLTGVNPKDIPYTDEKVISLFSSTDSLGIEPEELLGETTGAIGIPEFGTQFVRAMLKSVKVKTFSDLVSISGLSHGTDVWANNGEKLVKEQKKTIKELISCRDDIMTDLINKGMDPLQSFLIMEQVRKGKSVNPEQEKEMRKHNVEDWYIDSCKAIKYMFPKAHATAYVQMAWKIAWFKTYYPLAYYATYLTTRADVFDVETFCAGSDKIKEKLIDFKSRKYKRGDLALTNKEIALIPILEIVLELYARGFKIGNINIDKSLAREWVILENENTIIPPFSAIDGLGDAVADSIIKSRNERPFSSVEDLKKRTSLNKTSLAKLEELEVFKGMQETNQLTLF